MSKKLSLDDLKKMKQAGEKITCLTSYDASFARVQDEVGVDLLLVGDSLGMVLHGDDSTLNVSMDDMVYHTRLVSTTCQRAMVISDMPYQSYTSPEQALENAKRLIQEGGAELVKLEGGAEFEGTVSLLTKNDIAVCGHLGLLPQSIEKIGGYGVQAKTDAEAEKLKQDALCLQNAGAVCLVLECVPAKLAGEVSKLLEIPVIGIGAGVDCDAQVLVIYDILGLTEKQFKFSKNFLTGNDSIAAAIKAYVDEVKAKTFPAAKHSF